MPLRRPLPIGSVGRQEMGASSIMARRHSDEEPARRGELALTISSSALLTGCEQSSCKHHSPL